MREAGIPWTQFDVWDVASEYEKLTASGVEISVTPTEIEDVKFAIQDDTSGNLIHK